MTRHRRALCAALLMVSCATPSVTEQAAATRGALASFSAALAQAGMSVPLPPRVCEEPAGEPRWDDEVGCLDGAAVDERAALVVYARALVQARLGHDAAPRAGALVDAYLAHHASFAGLAQAIEREFDAKRTAKKAEPKKPAPKKPPADDKKPDVAPAVAVATPAVDAGPPVEPAAAAADAGVKTDAGVVRSVRDQLIGTWVVASAGPVANVYALCADGRATVKPETTDAAIAELIGDMPAGKGTWEVTQEDPPKVAFTWGSERYEGEITALSADSVTIDYGEETVTAERRSVSASCE